METEWFYVKDGQQLGPVSRAELDRIVQRGEIGSDSLVWQEGMDNWEPYADLAASPAPTTSPTPAPEADGPNPSAGPTAGTRPCTECGRTYPEGDLIPYGDQAVCPSCKPAFFAKVREQGGGGARPIGQSSGQNGLALAGMICGIMGIVGTCCYGLGSVMGIVGLILSIMGLNKAKQDPMETGKGMAVAGLILSIISLLIGLGIIVLLVFAIASAPSSSSPMLTPG